jgi:hypothetical protein
VRALLGTIIIESHTKEECARGNKVGVVVGGKERCRRQRSWISGLRTIRIVWLLLELRKWQGRNIIYVRCGSRKDTVSKAEDGRIDGKYDNETKLRSW